MLKYPVYCFVNNCISYANDTVISKTIYYFSRKSKNIRKGILAFLSFSLLSFYIFLKVYIIFFVFTTFPANF